VDSTRSLVDTNLAQSTPSRRASLAAAIALAAVCALALTSAPAARTAPTPVNDISTNFGWIPAAPTVGQVITFTASASAPVGVSIKSYDWDFGSDGKVDAHGPVATWSYPVAATYTATLVVRGSGKHRGQSSHSVTVGGGGGSQMPPVASFSASPAAPVASQPVLFTSTSSDPDGTIQEQVWDLNGDGSYDNGGGATALRTFATPGEYVVGLRVTDNDGLVSFDSKSVEVQPTPGSSVEGQKAGPRLLSPFPVVRIAGRITRRGTRVRLLRVETPIGTKVSVRCTGRGCPFKKNVHAVSTRANSRAAVGVRVRRLERLMLPGVQVRIYVTKKGAIGKYTRVRFRRSRAPERKDRCVMPGKWTPVQCPAA
jgi:hypothetical protein